MRCLVTGGAGFIGSHLADRLIAEGAEVIIADNLASGYQEYVHPRAQFHQINICDADMRRLIAAEKPDIVFHLAAQTDVQQSIRQPSLDAETNVIGTIRLLETCCESAVRKFIFSSTSGVYGDRGRELVGESTDTAPISYYGLSKLVSESYIRLFHRLRGLSYTILRYANVYGPRQTVKGEGGVVAIFISQLLLGQPLTINGDGEQTRDFVYVGDVVQANLAAVKRAHNETVNVGTAVPTSVNRLAELLQTVSGADAGIRHLERKAGDIRHSCLDNRKAAELLHWSPSSGLEAGLRATYASWREARGFPV